MTHKYQKQTPEQLAYNRRYHAAVPGRRAKQVGPYGRVLVAVKADVPPGAFGAYNPCAFCPERTKRPADAAGRFVCGNCRPKPRPVPAGKVGRLCVRCDRQVIKSPEVKGPFLCDRCRRFLESGTHHKPGHHTVSNPSSEDAGRAARVERLAKLYGEVERHGTESAARAAGRPTTLEEFDTTPEVPTHDTPASAGGNGDDGEEEDAG